MRELPLWCPRISKLQLDKCAPSIIDASLSCALERWSTNNFTALGLFGCELLTDAVLPIIEKCCPQLISLGVEGTKISKEALLQFVMSIANNKVFRLVETVSDSHFWMVAELRKHGG